MVRVDVAAPLFDARSPAHRSRFGAFTGAHRVQPTPFEPLMLCVQAAVGFVDLRACCDRKVDVSEKRRGASGFLRSTTTSSSPPQRARAYNFIRNLLSLIHANASLCLYGPRTHRLLGRLVVAMRRRTRRRTPRRRTRPRPPGGWLEPLSPRLAEPQAPPPPRRSLLPLSAPHLALRARRVPGAVRRVLPRCFHGRTCSALTV